MTKAEIEAVLQAAFSQCDASGFPLIRACNPYTVSIVNFVLPKVTEEG